MHPTGLIRVETVNRYLFDALRRNSDRVMQTRRDDTWTFGDAARAMHGVALRLKEMGVAAGDRVALISENSPRWLHAFGGVLATGAVAVPRGVDIADEELSYILEHSGAKVAFTAGRALSGVDSIDLDGDDFPEPADVTEAELSAYGSLAQPEDLVALLYTSGTTGRPKGVMLEHRNIAHNLRVLPPIVGMGPGDMQLSILPSWHTFELTMELGGLSNGGQLVYTDKRRLKQDLKEHRPQFLASVPRIWQAIHAGATAAIRKKGKVLDLLFRGALRSTGMWKRGNPLGLPLHLLGKALFYGKIQAATGGRLKAALSGGGYLPEHIDAFFNHVGVTLLVGYGLTETAPVIAVRHPEANVIGTIGRAAPDTEIRVGKLGTFEVRGPQVMRGYYKDEEATRAVLDSDGWFDTGDLGRITDTGDLVFIGRLKETIVLSGGENVEPEPIETAILRSPLIQQAMLVGQDRNTLSALVVPEANETATQDELLAAVRERTSHLRTFERVNRIAVIDEPFAPENGLMTATLKMKRNVIAERYAKEIAELYGTS